MGLLFSEAASQPINSEQRTLGLLGCPSLRRTLDSTFILTAKSHPSLCLKRRNKTSCAPSRNGSRGRLSLWSIALCEESVSLMPTDSLPDRLCKQAQAVHKNTKSSRGATVVVFQYLGNKELEFQGPPALKTDPCLKTEDKAERWLS